MMKQTLLATCAMTALVLGATPAFAQEGPPAAEATAPDPAAVQAEAVTSDPAAADTSGDIVVTAQGRAQALADVPVAVSAVSAASLERSGATDIRQLAQIAPSLLVSSTGNEANGSARLRGIGTVGDNPGLESSVAVFVDGVYRSRSGIGLNELGDIERVEVLRGPQGTLFGRNASAGIISIVSKAPNPARFSAGAEVTYGNYDFWRLAGNVNVPLSDNIAARVDGVYVKRDGFLQDVTNSVDVNNRDRYFVRGQLLFEPTDALRIRLIGDYTKRDEDCCGAAYIGRGEVPANGDLLTGANPIIGVLQRLGQPAAAFSNPYSRDIYVTPGRTYAGETEDWGVSGQIDYDFGDVKLVSVTGYRQYSNWQAGDVDYSFVDIIYRDPGENAGSRKFKTFSQELRLQGTAFGGTLDWLVGGYYGNEDLTTRENLKFGTQYGRFASCRLLASTTLAPFQDASQSGCLSVAGRNVVIPGAFGAAAPTILAAFDRLDQVRNVGDDGSRYFQNSRNFAFFTHNIVHVAEGLDLTLGLRYTNERKRLDVTFRNTNTFCPAQQAALTPFLTNPGLQAVAAGLIGLACQGNSTSELNGVSINDQRNEEEFTGTAILSYKLTPDLLVYGSYARGYKAGGFNLDRSALKPPTLPFAATPGGAQGLVNNLEFDQEINNAFEVGAKYSSGPFSINVAGFRQEFKNFQLNTFNGTVFLVQNINACDTGLNGGDRDLVAATGACNADDVQAGVTSTGVEIEATLNPHPDLTIQGGLTYVQTKFRDNLVGTDNGAPLDPALRRLPGSYMSNAPATVATSSITWTPPIGDTGFTGLVYVDGRMTSDYNTGSDKFPQKAQDGFFLLNARLGLRAPQSRYSIEVWAQNLLNHDYTQVAFNAPFQAAQGPGALAAFPEAQYPGGTQIFSAFLAEPRTYGVTLRARF